MESSVSDIEDKLPPLVQEAHTAHQLAKETDMGNRLCCNNIHIVGLPEKMEGRNLTTSVESWLIELFRKDIFSPFFTMERAHRTPDWPLPVLFD